MAAGIRSTEGDKGQNVVFSSQEAMVPLTDRYQEFTWIVHLITLGGEKFKTTQNSKSSPHAVLLDTQATGQNWISNRLITKLGMENQVTRDCVCQNAYGFTGERIECEGTIQFRWILLDGTTVHDPVTFHVSTTPLEIDMIFGAPYISKNRLLSSNQKRFLLFVRILLPGTYLVQAPID